ncbi:MAG: sugar phosphate nucleotidyltransferase [Candidatus Heimdallarchaeaceae archaeon]
MNEIDCAVILAGGRGSRLRPLTSKRPKPLVPVTLTPMIDFAIKQITDAGITRIIFAVKYLGDQIREYLESSDKFSDLNISIPEIEPKGTADAVRQVSDLIDGNFVVSMADIVSDLSVSSMIDFFNTTGSYASISLKNIDFPTKKFGVILLDEEQNIEIFLEKPRPQEMLFTTLAFAYRSGSEFHQNLVNTGIYIFNHKILEILENFKDITDFGQDLFPYLLQEKFKLTGFVGDYYWMDCGNIRSYLWANWDILRGFIQNYTPVGKHEGGVWKNENVVISTTAKIIPPVVLGNNVTISDGCTVGPFSVLGDNVLIEENSVIDHSVIWEKTVIEENSFIQKSVVCDNVRINKGSSIKNYTAVDNNRS